MTEKERELAEKYMALTEEAKAAKERANDTLRELANLAPHKIGEIIRWTETGRTKSHGTLWNRVYEELPDKERFAVLVSIEVQTYFLSRKLENNSEILYNYSFHEIKKDGGVSKNVCNPWRNYQWTGEIHKDYQKGE